MAIRNPQKKAALGAGAVLVGGAAASAAKLGLDRRSKQRRRFRLDENEPVSDGLRRIALGQLDGALEDLDQRSEHSVHEARKRLKRLRAVVRLARDDLGGQVYRRENRAFRDAGRRLSGARDAEVLLATLDSLGPDSANGLRGTLEAEHTLAERHLKLDGVIDEVLEQLSEARGRVSDWPLKQRELAGVAKGFRRIYRRARRAYRRAREDPSSDNLHELRKRTKDLWYAAQILRPASPKRMKRLAKDGHDLSDLIGKEHDLAVLAERMGERDGAVMEAIERRRQELVEAALPLAGHLFHKKPRKVARLVAGAR